MPTSFGRGRRRLALISPLLVLCVAAVGVLGLAPAAHASKPAVAVSATVLDDAATISYTVNRASQAIGSRTCTLDGAAIGCGSLTGSDKKSATYGLDLTGLASGQHTVTVTVVLTDGGRATASSTFTSTPRLDVSIGAAVVDDAATVTYTVNRAPALIASRSCTLDGATTACGGLSGSTTESATYAAALAGLTPGSHTFAVAGTLTDGRAFGASSTFTTIAAGSVAVGASVDGLGATVTYTVNRAPGDVTARACTLDAVAADCGSLTDSTDGTATYAVALTGLAPGSHTFAVDATLASGNHAVGSTTFTALPAPALTFTATQRAGGTFVDYTVTRGTSDIVSRTCDVDGTDVDCGTLTASAAHSATFAADLSDLPAGEHTFSVTVGLAGGDEVSGSTTVTPCVVCKVRDVDVPYAMAYVPPGELYVLNRLSNSLLVLDASTRALLATINLSGVSFRGAPQGIAYNPTNGLVYVSSTANDHVVLVDPETRQPTGVVGVGDQPRELAHNPVDGAMYVVDESGIKAIDPTTNTVVASTNLQPALDGLAFDAVHDRMVTGTESTAVWVQRSGAVLSLAGIASLSHAADLFAFPAGDGPYVAAGFQSASFVTRSDEVGTVVGTIGLGGALARAAMYNTYDGLVYIGTSSSVLAVDADTQEVVATYPTGNVLSLTHDPQTGNVYVGVSGGPGAVYLLRG